jgi:hypothetical protein|tara:strand:- start:1195 stop:1425 length:231 start_codon:yes stop_codon:yes gene_type:complete
MDIVKRSGEIQELDVEKLYRFVNRIVKDDETTWKIVNKVRDEIKQRYFEFYPNHENMKDMVEKYLILYEMNKLDLV